MKSKIVKLLLSMCTLLLIVSGCTSSKEDSNLDNSTDEYYYLTFDAYSFHEMAMLKFTMEDNVEIDAESFDFVIEEGKTVEDILADNGYNVIAAVCENDTFEGWMQYKVDLITDEYGNETYGYTLVSDHYLTTEEVFVIELTNESVMFTAKWEGLDVEEYYNIEY